MSGDKKVKDWFIIQRVKFLKLVKDHKYISAIIGVFLMSSIIAIIVFASDDPYDGLVVARRSGDIKISSTGDPETETSKKVKSFSTVVYDIPFELIPLSEGESDNSGRIAEITASIDKSIDAELIVLNDNVDYRYSENSNGEKKLEIRDYASLNSQQNIKIYLNIYNISNDTVISPTITVCDSTTAEENKTKQCFILSGEDTKVTVESKKVDTIVKTIPGVAYDMNIDGTNKRNIPFGILVGINEDSINSDGTLTGLYFNPNISLSLSAASASSKDTQINYIEQIETDDYYGLYSGSIKNNAKINILTKKEFPFPYHSINESHPESIPAVYNSGNIEYKKCDSSDIECNLFDDPRENVYLLKISGLKTDGRYVKNNSRGFVYDLYSDDEIEFKIYNEIFGGLNSTNSNENVDFLALGSYYVTATTTPQDTLQAGEFRANVLYAKYKVDDQKKDGLAYSSLESGNINNRITTETSFATDNNRVLDDVNEIAYGEEVILRNASYYEYLNVDSSSSKTYSLIGKIPVAAMKTNNGISPFNMVEYSSEISEREYFVEIDGSSENLDSYDIKATYVACTDLQSCSLDNPDKTSGGISFDSLTEFQAEKKENENLYLSYVKYEISNVPSGALVDFRLRLSASSTGYGSIKANAISTYSYEGGKEEKRSETKEIMVTPYKARVSLNIDGAGNEVFIDVNGKTSSTISVYPNISLPANIINVNKVPVSDIDEVELVISLPEKVTYVSNMNYAQPERIEENGTKLVYLLKNQNINGWIEPIMFDVNYDIDVLSNRDYLISAVINARTKDDLGNELIDVSSEQVRTSTARIRFLNTGSLSYSISSAKKSISKGESFGISTKIYNRSIESQSNLELITILPYNDPENSLYSGSYELNFEDLINEFNDNILCTDSVMVGTSSLENDSEWKSCSSYSATNYANVTAIKTKSINLESNKSFEQKIKVSPKGNNYSDSYKFISYIKPVNSNIIRINPITIIVEATKITGTVWEDFDGNGLMDKDELKLQDIELQLYDSDSDELVQTVFSDKNGMYTFDKLSDDIITETRNFYIVAKYNNIKYSLTNYYVGEDRSINSSFCLTKDGNCIVGANNTPGNIDSESDDDLNEHYDEEDEEFEEEEPFEEVIVARSNNIEVTNETRLISNINLGLTPKKNYSIKLNKYISSANITNIFGISEAKNFGRVSFAKLDVKDIGNTSIKVTYTIELENTGHYPGYVRKIKDIIPDGMKFNSSYAENEGWTESDNGYLEYNLLANTPIKSGEKKYITLSLDIDRKEAGTFVNYAVVEDSDLEIYGGTLNDLRGEGVIND